MNYTVGFEMSHGDIYVFITNTQNGNKVFYEKVTDGVADVVKKYNEYNEVMEEASKNILGAMNEKFIKEMKDKISECYYDIHEVFPNSYILENIAKKLPTEIFVLANMWDWDDTEVGDKVFRFIRDEFKG